MSADTRHGEPAAPTRPIPLPESSAPVYRVERESVTLAGEPGTLWKGGTVLSMGKSSGQGLPVAHAVGSASIVVHYRGSVLRRGREYLVNDPFTTLALAPDSTLTTVDQVEVSYAYSRRRIDSVVRLSDGSPTIRQGEPHVTTPHPPDIGPDETCLGNYFLDHFGQPENALYLPVLETADRMPSATTRGLLPGAVARLQANEPVRIVFWGDSITEGGDASSPPQHFPRQFERLLRQRYAEAPITISVAAVGGSQSRQWLQPDQYRHSTRADECDFNRVIGDRPDVVVVEFLNDEWMDRAEVYRSYDHIVGILRNHGAEVVLVTPNFAMPLRMGTPDPRTSEPRVFVKALRAFAQERRIALADAAAHWEHLWKRGIPYVTLLSNAINHPDDRGHAFYAEELIKCFKPT